MTPQRRRPGRPSLPVEQRPVVRACRLDALTDDAVCRLAVRRGISVNAVIRLAVRRMMATLDNDPVAISGIHKTL
jgi:hypothetical protein